MVLKKYEIEAALHAEKQEISAGRLKEDNPLDSSDGFRTLCEACRRGDLRVCQEKIQDGVNINARDRFDYTPLILASLCGHFEVCRLLLESGALCERDTFQGERCLYNALNDRIRNLLLSYDYSKSTDPLQPLAAHITSLLSREHPKTSDIILQTTHDSFCLHKFVLASRSAFFSKKLSVAPETVTWKLPNTISATAYEAAIRYIYFGEAKIDAKDGEEEENVLEQIDKLGRQLEIDHLFESIVEQGDRRVARQKRADEVSRGRNQLELWFKENLLKNTIAIETRKVDEVRWDRYNGIFADVLLRADEEEEEEERDDEWKGSEEKPITNTLGIPVGGASGSSSRDASRSRMTKPRRSVLFPAHRAMLIRSPFFETMFSGSFREAQETPHLQIIPVDCPPKVLEIVLTYLYTEEATFGLEVAIDVLFAADLLFIDRLKQRAALIISTLGNGNASIVEAANARGATDSNDLIDIYDVIRAGWDTRVQRLEEFGARYIAYRLESYIDEPEFAALVRESALRVKGRQETDTVELIDDIRYYLSERFRLRFEDAGLDEMMDETELPSKGMEGEGDDMTDNIVLPIPSDEGIDMSLADAEPGGVLRTLDGDLAGDEFAQDALNYQILLGKVDTLLDQLELDA